jgi:phosphotransferase system  glucose/maltose/N-acetylglucosamine-specific IIC component
MAHAEPGSTRDLLEVILGYGLIVGVIWMPEFPQRILSPLVLIITLAVLLARRPSRDELGLGWRGFLPSLWILPAAVLVGALSVLVAKRLGTLHPLFKGDAGHVAGYVLWTLYQQILLNDYFLARLTRLLGNGATAVSVASVLFAAAHLPSPWLTLATLVWGAISCALFRRYRNLYALGLAQGLLGLCFAICVPDALHHHLRVGLGYLRYGGVR